MTQLSDINQQSITIIVIDDDKDVRENMVDLLSTQYQHIQEFDSPKPAFATLNPQSPVVIITDLRMPGGDGLEFSKQVNALNPDIPIILMTGYGDITIAVEAMNFLLPVFIGDEVSCYCETEKIGRTSVAVKIETWVRRDRLTDESIKVTEAVYTYVSIDKNRRPQPLPK